jgi:regulatory protein YycH of two-component signal transduction system YycFG
LARKQRLEVNRGDEYCKQSSHHHQASSGTGIIDDSFYFVNEHQSTTRSLHRKPEEVTKDRRKILQNRILLASQVLEEEVASVPSIVTTSWCAPPSGVHKKVK